MSDRDYMRTDWDDRPRNSFWATIPGTKALLVGLPAIHVLQVFLHRASPEAHRSFKDHLRLTCSVQVR